VIPALLLAAAAALAGPVAQAPSGPVAPGTTLVKLERRGGVELWSVHASGATVQALLARVAELSGRALEASTALERAPAITVALDRRPLEEVLEFALGSAGLLFELDAGTAVGRKPPEPLIRVRADQALAETPEQRASLAAAAWTRAAARHPRHPVAATAQLARGELAELDGQTGAARQRYLDVLQQAPASLPASEAYLRAGRLAAERGDWSEASEHFRCLANLPAAAEYRALARVELARATLRLGDAAGALHILAALDTSHPCWERTELTARVLLRVEALLEETRFQEALLELERRAEELDPLGSRELPRLRARALEGTGLAGEASRAWLLVARDELGATRSAAYRAAARLAEEVGDPLGVLFVAREAQAAGFGSCVVEPERRARVALGLEASSTAARPPARADGPERRDY
jgi:hypothetical protein